MPRTRAARDGAPGKGTVLARVIANILSGATQQGIPRDALLEAAGLRGVDFSDPDARVPSWIYVALWQLIARHSADPGIGIRMGSAVEPRQWGLLGYAMAYSSTLGAGLRRLVRYGRMLNEAYPFGLEGPSGQHVAIVQSPPEPGIGHPYAVNYRCAILLGASRRITRADVVPVEVAFAYEQPASTLDYHRFFRCPLRFGQPLSKITFAQRDVDLPIPGGDETLAGYLSENAEGVLRTLCSGGTMRERVRTAIWAALSDGPPKLGRVASVLQVPPRTLQRHLAAEGTSVHQEVEYIRRHMAVAALRERAVPIEEVAFILGYTEPSTFYRSFRRWTGRTPRQYRASATR